MRQGETTNKQDTALLDRDDRVQEQETGNREGRYPTPTEVEGDGAQNQTQAVAPAPPTQPTHAAPEQPQTEAGETGGEQAPPEQPERKRRPWMRPLVLTLLAIGVIIGGIWGYNYWQFSKTHVSTDDAYLTTDIVQITPQVSANVTQVLVDDNQHVKAGQLLATLDDSTFRAAVAQAKADLAQAEAAAQGASTSVGLTAQTGAAQIEQAQGGVAQAESGVSAAQADVERYRAAITNAQAGERSAQADVRTAQAGVQSAITSRQRALAGVQAAQAQLQTAQAAVKAAQAAVVSARANADRASRDEARYAALYQQDAVSAQQVDVATAAATQARAQLDAAQQQVVQAQAAVTQQQSNVRSAQEAVRNADATIAQARAQLSAAQQGVSAAQAGVRQAQAQLTAAQQNVGAAEAKRAQALGQLNQARTAPRQVAVSKANQQTANAKILQAQAALDTAQINLARTRIYAPLSGTIGRKSVDIGQQVAVGQQIMAITPDNDIWVSANYKETQMGNVRPGQTAEIDVDTFPGHKFHGHVDSIAPATGATFSLLPPDNATGNFTKVVQRVPVKVTFDPGQPLLDRLRAGLSAVVTIATK